jgi:hypothetical protein
MQFKILKPSSPNYPVAKRTTLSQTQISAKVLIKKFSQSK